MFQIFSDFPFPDRSIYSPEEELFKKQIIKACGIQIRQTLLSKGSAKQAFLYIWADISQHENFIMTSAVKAFFWMPTCNVFVWIGMRTAKLT